MGEIIDLLVLHPIMFDLTICFTFFKQNVGLVQYSVSFHSVVLYLKRKVVLKG